jgi:triosephosphate isomerase
MKKMIIGNLKANILSLEERERYIESLKKGLAEKKMKNAEMVICPPFVHLEYFSKNVKNKTVQIGAQNVFWEDRGSFTGEVTAPMLKGLGIEFAIVGHSERRSYFGETDEAVNRKVKNLLKKNITPIICVGETKAEREGTGMKEVITAQILDALDGIPGGKLEKIIIAYEPIWAVGTDVFPSSNEVMEARILIKKILIERYNVKNAERVRILYGGSVNPKMTKQVCLEPGMDGVLVGRASLAPADFLKIAEVINNA